MSKISIIYIISNFTNLDAYIPIPFQIKKKVGEQLFYHDTLILSHDQFINDGINLSKFHVRALSELGIIHYLSKNKVYKVLSLSLLLLKRYLFTKNIIVIWKKGKSKEENFFYILFNIFSKIYNFHSTQGICTNVFAERYKPNFVNYEIELGVKKKGNKLQSGPKRGICYTVEEMDNYNKYLFSKTKYLPIGIPRLSPIWKNVKSKIGSELIDNELKKNSIESKGNEIITILLTNPGPYYWFINDNDFSTLLDECIAEIRSYFPEPPIFCKAKPHMRYLQDQSLVDKDFSNLSKYDNVYYTYESLATLSLNTILAISIQESSGSLEFLFSGIPVIEYSRYSESWKKYLQHETPWIDVPGYKRATNSNELNEVTSPTKI